MAKSLQNTDRHDPDEEDSVTSQQEENWHVVG